jgi:hypothetical protein
VTKTTENGDLRDTVREAWPKVVETLKRYVEKAGSVPDPPLRVTAGGAVVLAL